jgi:putative ABC transport system ATP-binding protein
MLEIKNLSKTFSTSYGPVLRDLDLTISPGTFCVIVGGNGSGKSTLLRCVAGILAPDQGTITLNNQIIPVQELFKHVSLVTQDPRLGTVPELTLLENMVLAQKHSRGLSFYQNAREQTMKQVAELGLGLEAFMDKPLDQLSGGQRQTIATLMGLINHPEVLLLDEHTSALDPASQHKLMAYTNRVIQENHITALMVTHNLQDAITYGHRLIMLDHGVVILDVQGAEKQALKPEQLITLYQQGRREDNHAFL